MSKSRTLGKLPPRYSFILNPHSDFRLSKCPKCARQTHQRKFPLFIHIDGWGGFVLGKTCKYCTPCELIMAFQDELETELTIAAEKHCPEAIGNDYLVVGTVEKKTWKEGLGNDAREIGSILDRLADFKEVLDVEVDPGGWRPA